MIDRRESSLIVLVTVCTDRRRPLLARSEIIPVLETAWNRADSWLVGNYVVLPDHLHVFCTPASPSAPPLKTWIKYWKSIASRTWPHANEHPIWQRDFWDRQLRHGEHYSARWDYVRNNPVRHGLAPNADAWPYRGELNAFRFRDAP